MDIKSILLLVSENRERITESLDKGEHLLIKSHLLHIGIYPGVRCRRCSGPVPKVQGRRLCTSCSPEKRRNRRPNVIV
jgi:hypothetical protein